MLRLTFDSTDHPHGNRIQKFDNALSFPCNSPAIIRVLRMVGLVGTHLCCSDSHTSIDIMALVRVRLLDPLLRSDLQPTENA
jgi:hypothetical protein